NDGWNWKGDPNATYTGQGVPQYRPGEEPPGQVPPPLPLGPPPPPIAAFEYDPGTGMYVGTRRPRVLTSRADPRCRKGEVMAEHVDASAEEVTKPAQPESDTSEKTSSLAPEVDLDDAEDYDGALDADVDEDSKDVATRAKTM